VSDRHDHHGPEVRRRAVISAMPVIPVAAVLGVSACSSPRPSGFRFFTAHEGAVVEDATARIAPGPDDDPAEQGHPGAREAGVVHYIDAMLSMLDGPAGPKTPGVFAGGPWSSRHTSGPDMMASFIALDPVSLIAWRKRIGGWQQRYRQGVATLDKLAGGDYTAAAKADQDKYLAKPAASSFLNLLFEHTIEGLYANPEYGGNRGEAGWKDIGYPGDSQPRGYTDDEVTRSDGPDPVDKTPIVAEALKFLGAI
jgi:gluconate 2-dehydrogenase gamma chain